MRNSILPKSRELAMKAEQQMRSWALGLQMQQRQAAKPLPVDKLIHPYVAIARETGVDAGGIARRVADQLHWHLLDREVLEYVSENHNWPEVALESVDERPASWYRETFGHWLDQRLVTSAEFVRAMGHVILMAAQHEPTVFVGRGAQFLLPREAGVAVRLIASKRTRIARLMASEGCDHANASRVVEQKDKDRADFLRTYFHHDVADAANYELVINLDRISDDDAASLIVDAAKVWIGSLEPVS